MNKLSYALFFSLTMFVLISFGSILSGTDTLLQCQGIDIENDSIYAIARDQNCPDNLCIIFADVEACCLAIGCHCGLRLGSPKNIYLSKKIFNATDFDISLNLQDTSLFKSGDTLHTFHTCNGYPSLWEPSDIGSLNWKKYKDSFLVVKSKNSKWVLIKVVDIYIITPSPIPTNPSTITPRVQLTWFLQTDNSTSFKAIADSKLRPVLSINPSRVPIKTIYYKVNGQTLNIGKPFLNQEIIIEKQIYSNGFIKASRKLKSQKR